MKWLSDATLAHLCEVAGEPGAGDGRYELIEPIGRGGMGVVFLARDRTLDRLVALKILNVVPASPGATARMAKEACVTARLEHPGIVPVHDAGLLPDGRFYYVMKLVRGERLEEQAHRTPVLAERLQLFRKICDAVSFAHANGFVHRDLKPQNVMVGSYGEVLVLDWGLAREIGARRDPSGEATKVGSPGAAAVTAAGAVLGTPGYMAPEQADSEVGRIDERTDVYALGGVLYFLLAGRAPVRAPPPSGSGTAPTRPRRLDRSIPRPLEAVCMKALAADPAERYAGAAELAAEVADFLARRRVRAYREGLAEAAFRVGMKYRAVLSLLLAYLVVRILLLVFLHS